MTSRDNLGRRELRRCSRGGDDVRLAEEVLKAHTLARVPLEQTPNEGFDVRRDLRRDLVRPLLDALLVRKLNLVLPALDLAKEINVVLSSKGRLADAHFEQNRSDAPEVRLGVVFLVSQDLGRHVEPANNGGELERRGR